MKKIWKFVVDKESVEITAPITQFLTAQINGGKITVWAEVNTNNTPLNYELRTFETNEEISDSNYSYLGTIQDVGGLLVLHIYYKQIV